MHQHSDSSDPEPDVSGLCQTSISEETHEMMICSDGDGPGSYLPPPHIAARFYRSSTARRKSSATSSRRNSMSSHHSSRSTRSAHGGPYSTHVAQHLRRASIIETRKARLAERAAHAEKVRLRAAMAKAAPRVSPISEERAIAAKQARERFLAQVAANCAEEVKRAKRVAEDTREKKAAEHIKLKEDLEERAAEAERRRLLHNLQQGQRRAKASSLQSVEEKKVITRPWKPRNDEEAAKLIQKAWRNRQRRHIVSDFMQLGLTVENIQETSFEDVGVLLSQGKVLACTSKMLKLCGLQDGEGGSLGERTATRTFLSSFLILGHPSYVLSQYGVQEQDLSVKAKDLLLAFGRIVSTAPNSQFSPLSTQLAALSEAYSSFQTAFTAWKRHDASTLINTMLLQFVELDAIWQTVKNNTDGDVAADYREGIKHNQTLLLARLKRLAGPEKALQMIRYAIRTRRSSSAKKKPAGDVRPRETSNVMDTSTGSVVSAVSAALAHTQTGRLVASNSNRSSPLDPQRRSKSALPDNRTMVHELAINKEYRIDLKAMLENRESFIIAMSANIRAGMQSQKNDEWIVNMARYIRANLLGLVIPGKSLHVLISETLDPAMIANQVKMGAFSYQKFFAFMDTILPKLCAPVRDAEIKALAEDQSEDFVERLARLHYVIDLLRVDNANFSLQRSAPAIIERASQYEDECFRHRMGALQPNKMIRWWAHALTKTREGSTRRAAEGSPVRTCRVTLDKIYMQGLVDLAIAVTTLADNDVPETLELDQERIQRIRSEILRMIAIDSILLTAKNLLKRDVRSQWKAEAQRMWDLPYNDSQAFFSIVENRYAMPPSTKSQLSGTIERVLVDARNRQATHPVMKVLLQKMKTHVFTRLSAASADERVRATTTASEVLASSGLPEFVVQIGALVDELTKVAAVDRAAHGKWYDDVAAFALSHMPESS